MGGSDGMEPEDDKTKKLNDDFVEFVRKRSDTEAPRYTARLKAYVDLKRKRDRANVARDKAATKKKADDEQKDQGLESNDHTGVDKERIARSSVKSVAEETSEGSFRSLQRRDSSASSDADSCVEPFLAARLPARPAVREDDKVVPRGRSRSRSYEPSDRCCQKRRRRRRRRRRRSCGRRRRRRSCGRRRRRRRSCGRRRRRSCRRRRSRRRRRRSCARRRRRRCRRRR